MSRFEEMLGMAAATGMFGSPFGGPAIVEVRAIRPPHPPRHPGCDQEAMMQAARRVGYLEAENEALRAENEQLRVEIRGLQAAMRYNATVMGAAFSHIEELENALDDSDTGEEQEPHCCGTCEACCGPAPQEGGNDGA